MRTGFGRHREQPPVITEVVKEQEKQVKETEKIVDVIKEEFPEAEIVVVPPKPEVKKEVKKTVERKPVRKKAEKKEVAPVVEEAPAKHDRVIGVAINGNTKDVKLFRSICKLKGLKMQDELVKFLKAFNEANKI